MNKTYQSPAKLSQFGHVPELQPARERKFFNYYGEACKKGALNQRGKALKHFLV